jgi:hypothetical protein
MTATRHIDTAEEHGRKNETMIEVHCDYLGADDPIKRKFGESTLLSEVRQWAREHFVPSPPSDKAYFLNDDKTRHRFTAEEEAMSLVALGYKHKADLRLTEEQLSGGSFICDAFAH